MKTLDPALEYNGKTDRELLCLALAPREQLTEEAKNAPSAEMARRQLGNPKPIAAFRREESERKAEDDRDLGTLGFPLSLLSGRMRFGKSSRVYDQQSGLERPRTTVFVELVCFPLIPTGTYLVERNSKRADDFTSLERLPLDWILGPPRLGCRHRNHTWGHFCRVAIMTDWDVPRKIARALFS